MSQLASSWIHTIACVVWSSGHATPVVRPYDSQPGTQSVPVAGSEPCSIGSAVAGLQCWYNTGAECIAFAGSERLTVDSAFAGKSVFMYSWGTRWTHVLDSRKWSFCTARSSQRRLVAAVTNQVAIATTEGMPFMGCITSM